LLKLPNPNAILFVKFDWYTTPNATLVVCIRVVLITVTAPSIRGDFMDQKCWQLWADRGFLICPDPIQKVSDTIHADFSREKEQVRHVEAIAADLPNLLENKKIRATLDTLPVYDFTMIRHTAQDFGAAHWERLWQIYAYFASSYIYATDEEPEHRIPPGVAIPLVAVSRTVERPPILDYAGYVLNNWQRIDPNGGINVENLRLNQAFLGNRDEAWFILIHVDIEARAADALRSINEAAQAVKADDVAGVERALSGVYSSVEKMLATFRRMPEQCDSNVYYFKVRPYIFGFTDVVYEGVKAYAGAPQTFRGQTGAQSSIIPALVAAFGLQHEQNTLTHHLEIMKAYMPRPHREFIDHMRNSGIREFVQKHVENRPLAEAYNECLRAVTEFRKQHYHYATTYIFEKVSNPLGTGGTVFMDWLGKLISETEAQFV
jgi:indoleamine 2,3-dioxygenase